MTDRVVSATGAAHEFGLLAALAGRRGKALTRLELVRAAWSDERLARRAYRARRARRELI